MPNVTLTDARVTALQSRRASYDIRDGKLTGFGVTHFIKAKTY